MNDPLVYEVTDQDFQERVLIRSREVPVAVDFYADWCQPCKVLSPVLDRVVGELRGGIELAKIDVDRNPQVTMALRIQSMPTVVVFKDGQPVDGFQGAQPERAVREFLAKHAVVREDDPAVIAEEAMAAGHLEVAERAYQQMVTENADAHGAMLGLARIHISRGDTEAAAAWLGQIPPESAERTAADRLLGMLAFGEFVGDASALRGKVEADPKDVEAWYALGATLALSGDTEAAMDAFLKVVATDRGFRDDGGRAALLSLFDLLGTDDPAVLTCRRRLAALLF